ncbi:MAG: 50S ribosomal protein L32 [Phycisphaerales bacterium JB043]
MHPTHRISKGRTRRRRSHLALRPSQSPPCPNCGTPKIPHRMCVECGYVRPGLKLDLAKG